MVDALFRSLWDSYCEHAPHARKIHRLLEERDEAPANDHIALRTFALPGMQIEDLAKAFVADGYAAAGDYVFPAKKLDARHFAHPNRARPKVFISALRVGEMSADSAARIGSLAAQLEEGASDEPDFVNSGRRWDLDSAGYEALRRESEYAAWVAAFGFRANHFTILFNSLRTFTDLRALCDFVSESGIPMSEAGGLIKGSAAQRLEQASTLAEPATVALRDSTVTIPGSYYEFARRYPDDSGELYGGFIPESANRIFESTDRRD